MKKLFFTIISLIGCTVSAMAQCPPAATSSSNVVLTQRVAKVGMLKGVFSVAANKKVSFSKGNLQYQASTGTWRFAEHQWDCVGNAAGNTTAAANRATQSAWIDLFGYGTSGYSGKYPYMNSTTNADYPFVVGGTNYDWGRYAAGAAGQLGSGWYSLTMAEMMYLIQTRRNPNNEYTYAFGEVHGQKGLILLPDGWYQAVSAMAGTLTLGYSNTAQVISDDNWTTLENEGAVFLPFAGRREGSYGISVEQFNLRGFYWFPDSNSRNTYAPAFYFGASSGLTFDTYYASYGGSVRLVQTAP